MLIRLQDGHGLVNLDAVGEIYATDSCAVIAFLSPSGTQIRLASYETIDKVLKVLDMIQESYQFCMQGYPIPPKVFQMPQDDEVEL